MYASFETILAACEHTIAVVPQTSHDAALDVLCRLGIACPEAIDIVAHCLDSYFADRLYWSGEFSFVVATLEK